MPQVKRRRPGLKMSMLELAAAMPRIAQEKGYLSTWQAKHKVTKLSSFRFVSVNQSVGFFLVQTLLVWQRFTASTSSTNQAA